MVELYWTVSQKVTNQCSDVCSSPSSVLEYINHELQL